MPLPQHHLRSRCLLEAFYQPRLAVAHNEGSPVCSNTPSFRCTSLHYDARHHQQHTNPPQSAQLRSWEQLPEPSPRGQSNLAIKCVITPRIPGSSRVKEKANPHCNWSVCTCAYKELTHRCTRAKRVLNQHAPHCATTQSMTAPPTTKHNLLPHKTHLSLSGQATT